MKHRFSCKIPFILIAAGVVLLGCSWMMSSRYVIPIMMYHNVDVPEKPTSNVITPERFQYHMDYLKKHGYQVIRLDELTDLTKGKRPRGGRYVAIIFDDGGQGNY